MSIGDRRRRIVPIFAAICRNRLAAGGVHARMKRTIPGASAVLLLLAACAAPGGTPGSSSSDSPSASPPAQGAIDHPGGDEPVLVIEDVGGFAMVDMIATRLPSFVMLGDGRVIMQGAQTLEFPGPALPALQERTLTEEGIQQVLGAIEETNLFTADLELRGAQAMVADATDTVFHLNADGREVTVSVYALGLLDPSMGAPQGVTASELEAHRLLSQLRDSLMTIDTAVSADGWESEGWQPFQPEAFRLYVRDVTGEPLDDLAGQVREWPSDDDPATVGEEQPTFGNGTRCLVVDGDAAATWLTELEAANQNTRWTDSGDRRFSVQARPLLPGDKAECLDVVGG
jgi:hypothetical protein